MDTYITTYQKAYTWPSTAVKQKTAALNEAEFCRCEETPKELKPIDRCGDEYEWSRTGPSGRLLDPKLYPAKTGPYPETEATKFDQPSTYMKKLEEKYPNLYGILQSTPIEEVIKRVDEDRMRTTYQIDYSEKAGAFIAEAASGPCATAKRKEKLDCQPSAARGVLKRRKDDSAKEAKKKSKRVDDDSQETRLPPWRSEYQDGISRLGQAIMKVGVHQRKKAAPAWATAAI